MQTPVVQYREVAHTIITYGGAKVKQLRGEGPGLLHSRASVILSAAAAQRPAGTAYRPEGKNLVLCCEIARYAHDDSFVGLVRRVGQYVNGLTAVGEDQAS